MKRLFTGLVATIICLSASAALASPIVLAFEARAPEGAGYAEVTGAGKIILRLRGADGTDLLARAETIAERLNDAAFSGVAADAVKTRANRKTAALLVGQTTILTVAPDLARASGSSPQGLAASWAATLKSVLSTPYLVVRPHDQLTVPVGEVRRVKYGGTAGKIDGVHTDAQAVATATVDAEKKSIDVAAFSPGDVRLTITVGECTHGIQIKSRKWAARIAPTSLLQISGLQLREDERANAIECAIRIGMAEEPGANVVVEEPVATGGGYSVRISATGPDYLPVTRVQRIGLERIAPPKHLAPVLFVSNLPEKITEPSVLMRERLYGGTSARVLWHHINLAQRPLRMALRVHNLSQTEARFHLTQASAGPSTDELFVGHAATTRFMRDIFEGTGYVVRVPALASVDIADCVLGQREVASGLNRVVPMAGGEFIVEVIADEPSAGRPFFAATPAAYLDQATVSGYVFEGQRIVEMQHSVGGEWAFYSLGKKTDINSRGNELAGSYGVLHHVRTRVENPTDEPAICEFAVRARGGVARASFWLDNALVETPMLCSATEQVIYRTTLAPGATYSSELTTIPESGSHYPVLLTLRSFPKP